MAKCDFDNIKIDLKLVFILKLWITTLEEMKPYINIISRKQTIAAYQETLYFIRYTV